MAVGNTTYTRIVTDTLQDHGQEIFDNVSTNHPLLYTLQKKGNIKVRPGGRKFTHPLYYNQNTSFKSYSKLDVIDTPTMDDYTRAEYDIKTIAGSLVLGTFDMAANSGDKAKLLDLAMEVRMAAEISMEQVLGTQVFADGSTATDFGGLQYLINIAANTQTDVGGINNTTAGTTWWRNYYNTTGTAAFNTGAAGLLLMQAALNNTTQGRKGPRMVVTTKTVYSLYEIGLTANIRYTKLELGDAGFQALAYTTMPVVFDDNCPSGYMYFVDTDSLWLQVLSGGNMKVSEFQPSHNQLSQTALMYLFGNLTTGSRRTNGVLSAITA